MLILLLGCIVVPGVIAQDGAALGVERPTEAVYQNIADAVVHRVLNDDLDPTTASRLLQRAHRIDPQNGDVQYLLASLLADDQYRQMHRETYLRNALSERLTQIPRSMVITTLAELLVRQGRYTDILDLFHEESATEAMRLPMQQDVLPVFSPDTAVPYIPGDAGELREAAILYLTARLEVGPHWYIGAYLQRLRGRYPDNPELAYLDFSREERVSLSLLEWIDYRTLSGDRVPSRLLLHAIRVGSVPALRQRLAERYLGQGGEDVLASLAVQPEEDNARWIEDKLFWEYHQKWYDRLPPYTEHTDDDTERILFIDEDRDSFWEERYHLMNNTLHVWERDHDQNGIVERRIEFNTSGDVRVFIAQTEQSILKISYAPYPLVARVLRLSMAEEPTVTIWAPARPPRFSIGLEDELKPQWDPRIGRVTIEGNITTRFERQITSDDARIGNAEETTSLINELLERRMVIQP